MKLHITNLSPKVTEHELTRYISRYGDVLSVELSWARRVGRITGIAVVEMKPGDGLSAARALNGKALRHRRLYITPIGAPPRADLTRMRREGPD